MNMGESIQETLYKDKIRVCAFTGNRELGRDFSPEKLFDRIEELIKKGTEIFYHGGAKGFDLIAAECVLFLKKKYPKIKLVTCIPCLEQDKYYSEEEKQRYRAILKKSDEKIVLSEQYFKGCMLVRNRYMADKADALIAYKNKNNGGTAYTVNYFSKKYPFKEIFFI